MRWAWLGWISLFGCGPAVATGAAMDGDGSGTSIGPGDDDDSSSASATTGPLETGEVETADPDGSSGGPPSPICGADSPQQPLAVLTGVERTSIALADGSLLDLELPELAGASATAIDARGDRIAITVSTSVFENGVVHHDSVLALFDAAGTSLWTRPEPGALVGALHVADDGVIAATRSLEHGSQQGVLFTDHEAVSTVDAFRPQGPRGADGHVPGMIVGIAGETVPGWLLADAMTMQAAWSPPVDHWFLHDDGALLYVSAGKTTPWLVRERPSRPTFDVLSALAGVPGLRISRSSNARWLLVQVVDEQGEPQGWFRVSVEAGTAEAIDLGAPEGLTPLECYFPAPVIDGEGGVLMPMRDDAIAQVHRLDPATATWEPIGQAVTDVDLVEVTVHGDSYLLRGYGANTTFCPMQSFEPAANALAGDSLQLVRPVDGVAHVLPAAQSWAVVRPDGACVALVGEDTLTVLDVVAGTELELPSYAGVAWWSD